MTSLPHSPESGRLTSYAVTGKQVLRDPSTMRLTKALEIHISSALGHKGTRMPRRNDLVHQVTVYSFLACLEVRASLALKYGSLKRSQGQSHRG